MTEALVHADGRLVFHDRLMRCALGRGGVRVHKQEGDGATPAGLLVLRRVLYRADRVAIPRTTLAREPIGATDGWCDDPDDPAYNRPVQLPYAGRHEELWRRDALYDIVVVLGWNDAPVRRGDGSAIFLHLARRDYGPTDGCIALALGDLLEVLTSGVSGLRVVPGIG